MNTVKIQKIDNPSQLSKRLDEQILQSIKRQNKLQKLMQVQAFLDSRTWMTLEKTKEGHDVAYEYFKSIFNPKVIIIDDGKVINGDEAMYCRLSREEKAFVNKIDKSQEKGFFRMGRYLVFYIGSTTVVDTGDTISSDSTGPTGSNWASTTSTGSTGSTWAPTGSTIWAPISITSTSSPTWT